MPDSIEVPPGLFSAGAPVVVCAECSGQGYFPVLNPGPGEAHATECWECGGLGWVVIAQDDPRGV
jgi:DnaJ-class molecular chaperone